MTHPFFYLSLSTSPSPFHWISSLLLLSSNCVQTQTRFFSSFSHKILSYPSLVPKLKKHTKTHQRTKNFFPLDIKWPVFSARFPSFSFHRDFTFLLFFIYLFYGDILYYITLLCATMDSHVHHHQTYQQQNQPSSGLLRFRSAPSSLLSNPTPSFVSEDFGSGSFRDLEGNNNNKGCSKDLSSMNSHKGVYGGGLPPHYPRHGSSSSAAATSSSAMEGSYGMVSSMGLDHEAPHKGYGSSLLRQSSSPAGLFSNNICFQNGFATMKGVGNYGAVNGSNGELSPCINRLKNPVSFSPRNASSLGMLSQISELGSEDIEATSPDDDTRHGGNDTQHYDPGFPYRSWNDTPQLSENLSGLKRGRSGNENMFSAVQNGELANQVNMLSHHLSLPKTSAEMITMEKLLHLPDSVPCKIRAKRGCATHPRSIAERVRRTRISERMRKLQELVPNMDKQTNTADMLDLAVEYIKDLQKQFETLSEKRANCKCISMPKADTNQIA